MKKKTNPKTNYQTKSTQPLIPRPPLVLKGILGARGVQHKWLWRDHFHSCPAVWGTVPGPPTLQLSDSEVPCWHQLWAVPLCHATLPLPPSPTPNRSFGKRKKKPAGVPAPLSPFPPRSHVTGVRGARPTEPGQLWKLTASLSSPAMRKLSGAQACPPLPWHGGRTPAQAGPSLGLHGPLPSPLPGPLPGPSALSLLSAHAPRAGKHQGWSLIFILPANAGEGPAGRVRRDVCPLHGLANARGPAGFPDDDRQEQCVRETEWGRSRPGPSFPMDCKLEAECIILACHAFHVPGP